MDEKLSDLELRIIKELKKQNISETELPLVLRNLKSINPIKYNPKKINFPERHVKFLVFGDPHIGHMNYRPDIMDKMTKDAKKQHCDFALNAGDTLEGMSGRDGHIFELYKIGYTAQKKYFDEEFSKFDILGKDFKVFSIEAQDSHSGWYHNKANAGVEIGDELEKTNKHYKFIGYDEQDLILDNGLKLRLRHPGGGTAYAISYKLQRYIESISGGQKPHAVFQGHFHKADYLFYRNIHSYDVGCLEEQSPFMKKKGTPAHLGYWIVDMKLNRNKSKLVERVNNQFVPFFE